jgi:hypothetical protein
MKTTSAMKLLQNALIAMAKAKLPHRQSIETAPKDGTQFLAFDKGSYFNCWWHDNGYGEQYWMDDAESEPNPSHWMPLPVAPAKQDGGNVTSQ